MASIHKTIESKEEFASSVIERASSMGLVLDEETYKNISAILSQLHSHVLNLARWED